VLPSFRAAAAEAAGRQHPSPPPLRSKILRGRRRGWAVQVAPMKPKSKPPGTKRLKLKHDEPLSNFAFKFDMRRYSVGAPPPRRDWCSAREVGGVVGRRARPQSGQGRGLHSSTSQLNVSRF
jgi:hypothetical protein